MNNQTPAVSISSEICGSLQNAKVVAFAQSLIKKSYKEFFSGHVSEVHAMVDEAFRLLTESQNKPGMDSLIEAIHRIHNSVFIKDEHHWFYKTYKNYKVHIRPKEDYKKIEPYLKGKTVLDIGAGAGYFSLEIQNHGYDVTAMDVLDYRNGNAKDIKFLKMNSPIELPVSGMVDTAILKTVLHHISYENIPVLLKNIRKTAKRLIIEEDVFGLTIDHTSDTINLDSDSDSDPDLDYYCSLSTNDQKDVLMIIDFFGNIIVYGIDEMTLPFEFKTLDKWEEVLSETGWTVIKKFIVGFDKTRIHRPCQAWFVCD